MFTMLAGAHSTFVTILGRGNPTRIERRPGQDGSVIADQITRQSRQLIAVEIAAEVRGKPFTVHAPRATRCDTQAVV